MTFEQFIDLWISKADPAQRPLLADFVRRQHGEVKRLFDRHHRPVCVHIEPRRWVRFSEHDDVYGSTQPLDSVSGLSWGILVDGYEYSVLPRTSDPRPAALAIRKDPRLGAIAKSLRIDPQPFKTRFLVPEERETARQAFPDLEAVQSKWGIERNLTVKAMPGPQAWDLVLIGCGKTKRDGEHNARDMYTGPIYLAHHQIACHMASPRCMHGILSAEHGILPARLPIKPYNRDLEDAKYRAVWSKGILTEVKVWAAQIRKGYGRSACLLVLAGGHYIDGWADQARAEGVIVDDPLRGFEAGDRRKFAASLRRETIGRQADLGSMQTPGEFDPLPYTPRAQLFDFVEKFRAGLVAFKTAHPC